MSEGAHRSVNPSTLSPPTGFAHAMVAAPGRTVYLGGQAGHDAAGQLQGETLVEQFDAACAGVADALRASGGQPEHLVSLQVFVTDADSYRANLRPLGEAYRRHFGKHYPAMGLFEVTSLFDPKAMIELMGVAVIPDEAQR